MAIASTSASEIGTSAESIVLHGSGWWFRHTPQLKTVFRILFGAVWLLAGALKFVPGLVQAFPGMVQDAASTAPPWLAGWYSFWVTQANTNAALIVYGTGAIELLIAFALLFGFARKLAYAVGIVLALMIWAIPEGFGGPYGPGTGTTDIGTGIVYALVFLGLVVINAAFGPSRYSLDYYIERRFPAWASVAEMGSWGRSKKRVPGTSGEPASASTGTSSRTVDAPNPVPSFSDEPTAE